MYELFFSFLDGTFPIRKPKPGCKKCYDKINYCTYCSVPISGKISRHLLSVKHSDRLRTSEIKLLPKKSKERVAKLEILANEGNFKHNVQVLKEGFGNIVVARRSIREANVYSPREYLPCEYCLKFVVRRHLWSHIHRCEIRKFNGFPDPTQKSGNNMNGEQKQTKISQGKVKCC